MTQNPSHPVPSRLLPLATLAALFLLALILSPAGAQPAPDRPARAPRDLTAAPAALPTDQLIVAFAGSADVSAMSAAAQDRLMTQLSDAIGLSLTIVRPMAGGMYVVQLPSAVPEVEAARISAELAAQPGVAHAEPNRIMQLVGRPTQIVTPQGTNQVPDDASYADQWHYRYDPGDEEGLNLPPAWDISTGVNTTVVAVIDTGIRPHADMAGRILPGYDFITSTISSNDGNGRDNDASDPGDWRPPNHCFLGSGALSSSWHGTHVAGTIAANSNNGDDVAGVNWKARILPVRVLGACGGTTADIVDAVYWSAGLPVPGVPANPNPADVINLSLGGTGACGSIQAAFDAVMAAGAVTVVAAGNSNANASGFSPANCDNVITVAATNREGDRSWYSNFGAVVELSAPGGETSPFASDGVLSTLNDGAQGPGADSLAFYQGTSMAAPHVAGLASLIMGLKPALTPAQVTNLIMDTARDFPVGSTCSPATCGAGIADAFNALSAVDDLLTAPNLINPSDGATLGTATPTFSWSAVDGATSYQLQVSTNSGFSGIVISESALATTSFTPAAPLANGQYWWRVRAAAEANSPWSETRTFTINVVVCVEPDAPPLSDPSDGSTVDSLRPTFYWQVVANSTDYEFRLGEEPDVSDSLIVAFPEGAQYKPDDPLTAGTTYYWKVRARNLAGDCDLVSPWSDVWSVTIDEVASEAGQVLLPVVLDIPYVPPPQAFPLQNGDFELGPSGWSESSSQGWPLIVSTNDFEDLPTHSGIWVAWLGGDDNEASVLTQQVTVPSDLPVLSYYYAIGSVDDCGFDFASVLINGEVIKSVNLCAGTSMGAFARDAINLAAYAGQDVVLQFSVTTDESLHSNWYIDDVAFAAAATASRAPAGSDLAALEK